MAAIETEKIFALKIRESADDGSDFTNPDADYRMLFLGEDGLLHVKDSAGSVANPYSGGGGVSSGTTFPGTPTSGDLFQRTDINNWIFAYDGTRWRTVHSIAIPFATRDIMANSSSAITATSAPALAPVPYKGTYTLYLLTAEFMAQLFGGTSDGSNFWTVALDWLASDTTRTSLGTFVTSAQAVSTIAHHTIAVNAVLSTSAFGFDLLATETGTAPNLNMAGVVYAQIVAT